MFRMKGWAVSAEDAGEELDAGRKFLRYKGWGQKVDTASLSG